MFALMCDFVKITFGPQLKKKENGCSLNPGQDEQDLKWEVSF